MHNKGSRRGVYWIRMDLQRGVGIYNLSLFLSLFPSSPPLLVSLPSLPPLPFPPLLPDSIFTPSVLSLIYPLSHKNCLFQKKKE